MAQRSAVGVAVLGSMFLALTYGTARFAFGLFLPEISNDLEISKVVEGALGATPFVSFVFAIMLAPYIVRMLGTSAAAGTACLAAVAGLFSISFTTDVEHLIVGLGLCGISTGISSPIMAHAVHFTVLPKLRGRVNATINAGTSIGIALAVPAVMIFADEWRHAYQAFGIFAVLMGVAATLYLPSRHQAHVHLTAKLPGRRVHKKQWIQISQLSVLAFFTGFVSAVYWIFAPDFAISAGGVSVAHTSMMWLAVALGGMLGAWAGDLMARYGHSMSHAFALTVLAASLALLATNAGNVAFAYGSAATFGAAYMTLTGLYLVRGVQIMAGHPALGPIVPLIATATGQIVGAPLSGGLIGTFGYQLAFGGFAAFALIVTIVSVIISSTRSEISFDEVEKLAE